MRLWLSILYVCREPPAHSPARVRTWHFKERQFAATKELQYRLKAMYLNCDFAKGGAGVKECSWRWNENKFLVRTAGNKSREIQMPAIEWLSYLVDINVQSMRAFSHARIVHRQQIDFLIGLFMENLRRLSLIWMKTLSWNILWGYFVLLR